MIPVIPAKAGIQSEFSGMKGDHRGPNIGNDRATHL